MITLHGAEGAVALNAPMKLKRRGTGIAHLLLADREEDNKSDNAIALLLPQGRYGCLFLTDADTPVTIGGTVHRGGVAWLTEGTTVIAAGVALRVSDSMTARQTVWQATEAEARCPVCRGFLREGDAVTLCGRCEAPHHSHCFTARAGRCGVYGCGVITQLESEQ